MPQPPAPGVDFVPFNQRKDFWGNLPEYNLLNLASNEGKEYDKDLDLLFIGEFRSGGVLISIRSIAYG
jgi:hypothetical protein